ncbi:MAG: mechanosensitive ion channel family protein [Hungatella sp.]|jgi:small conductance mechanosensitive channel|nr:mechanosensitive ion channel family protein [Hungatella sp.]MCI9637562.1 mechanosensitive ion channel family protein [Hungatella sp.]
MIWNESAGLSPETLEIVKEVQQDLEQLTPNVILETMKSWIPGLVALGYRLLAAGVILMIGVRLAKVVQKMMGKTFNRMEMEVSLKKFLLSAIYASICILAIFVAAEKFGISSGSIIALLGSAGLALSLSLQNMLGNFAGGVALLLLKPFKVGDYIICGTEEGTVASIGLVYTTLNTMDNQMVILPNGSLSNNNLTNVTAQEKRRLEIKVGISYESDLKKAKEILEELFQNHPLVRKEEGILVFVDSLGDSAVLLGARGWVATGDYWSVKWEMIEKIKLTFDEKGIQIPYHQIDVHCKELLSGGLAGTGKSI